MVLEQINNYLEDDWDDNNLQGRLNSTEGYFLHPSDSLIASGDVEAGTALKGVYRPDWQIESGSPSSSNGSLVLDSSDAVDTPSNFSVGVWEITWNNTTSPSDGIFGYYFFKQDENNWWEFTNNIATSQYSLRKNNSGTFTDIISRSTITDTNQHTSVVKRDAYSNWEVIVDGVSAGTATDTFTPTAQNILLNVGQNYVTVNADNLLVQ